ncbi:hypothetical protein BDZ97DRAFT_1915209 [Flammula alnicola]|nr:hypothetical protein BDZ97DRAFT_1915209 [Flammula alnicola]
MAISFASFFTTLFLLVFVAQASPVNLVAKSTLDVFVPKIIKPDSTTVWVAGQNATVVWDTSDAPASISNGAAVVLNGYGLHEVLARGFNLRDGNVTVCVPSVIPGQYNITLFGDSGDYSPTFTIVNQPETVLGV